MVKCWDCDGSGRIIMFLSETTLTCDRCEGTGECPEIMKEWRAMGHLIKIQRLNQRITLRDAAKMNGISVDLRSKIERGIVDPALHGYD